MISDKTMNVNAGTASINAGENLEHMVNDGVRPNIIGNNQIRPNQIEATFGALMAERWGAREDDLAPYKNLKREFAKNLDLCGRAYSHPDSLRDNPKYRAIVTKGSNSDHQAKTLLAIGLEILYADKIDNTVQMGSMKSQDFEVLQKIALPMLIEDLTTYACFTEKYNLSEEIKSEVDAEKKFEMTKDYITNYLLRNLRKDKLFGSYIKIIEEQVKAYFP